MSHAESIIERLQAEGVRVVDFRFTDLAGHWRHTSIDAASLDARQLEQGFMIDGSSIPGWRDPTEADVALKPDLTSARQDPFAAQPTLILLANVVDPATGQGYEGCSRSVAARAEAWLAGHAAADRMTTSVATGYFIFDDVRIETSAARNAIEINGSESEAAGGQAYASGNPGHRPQPCAARYALSPADHQSDIRAEITSILASLGFTGIRHDHGQSPMQGRLAFKGDHLTGTADRIQLMKYVVQHVAASYGKSASFMPRPMPESMGSGMSLQHSLWKRGKPVFAGSGYADLSPQCLSFVAGIMRHARALNAFTNPTTNSYRRLRKKASEPVYLAYAAYNRSAAVRIPFAAEPAAKTVDIRFPDPAANPYLALAAIMMAGIDGIEQKLEPGDAMDRNLYDLGPDEVDDLPTVALSLREALDALEHDQDFLLRGDVMSEDLIASYVSLKRQEIERISQAVIPLEYELYYGS
ncbi:glutamine synthetase [Arboricoccus pini]|uniref:Glutamine synthetase n=1 Tax=Arboricoccus pini TaxID=1963835 RepID=A0A212QQ14_9PROT|nr:type I glutamate--ammonia ligase [Arboricoccus pini]SNB61469.1 glutamine synthetase [Arboricoccus pini]